MYARVVNSEIAEVGTPTYRPVFFEGRTWDCRNPEVRAEYMVAANWLQVVEVERPADTATHTTERNYKLVGEVPTVDWVARAWTAEELASRETAAVRESLTDATTLEARLVRLDAYKTDPEIVAALARANATVIPTQDLNRLIKVILRREERLTATLALLVRLIDPALLADVSDTIDN